MFLKTCSRAGNRIWECTGWARLLERFALREAEIPWFVVYYFDPLRSVIRRD